MSASAPASGCGRSRSPEVREWVIEQRRSSVGTLQSIEIGVNSPTKTPARGGPPIPDEGLSVNILAINACRASRGWHCR